MQTERKAKEIQAECVKVPKIYTFVKFGKNDFCSIISFVTLYIVNIFKKKKTFSYISHLILLTSSKIIYTGHITNRNVIFKKSTYLSVLNVHLYMFLFSVSLSVGLVKNTTH